LYQVIQKAINNHTKNLTIMTTQQIQDDQEYILNGITFNLIESTDEDITIEYLKNDGRWYLQTIEHTNNLETVAPFAIITETLSDKFKRAMNNYQPGQRVI
jgi:hypothetical protein